MPAHPSYPNPTIHEALCEIYFEPVASKPAQTAAFIRAVQSDYSEVEPVVDFGVQLQFGPSSLGQPPPQVRPRLRFRHASRPLYLQLANGLLTVHLLPKYPGWDEMKSHILDAWADVHRTFGPGTAQRGIFLRYINRIPRTKARERPSEWFGAGPYIPQAILDSEPGFALQVQAQHAQRVMIALGDEPGAPPNDHGAFFLDIGLGEQFFSATAVADPGLEGLTAHLDRLHETAWEIFATAKTSRLDHLLAGEPQ